MGRYWPLEEQMLAARGEVLLGEVASCRKGGRLGRGVGERFCFWEVRQRYFQEDAAALKEGFFGEILEEQAGYSETGEKNEKKKIRRERYLGC